VQGNLGDCYLLSACAVLGDKMTRERFIFEVDDEWEECGAFCVRFFDDGKEDIVIVDDFLPFIDDGSEFPGLLFASSPGKEIWPSILEKAFAKKFGSYDFINKGQVDIALSILTNGVPEKIVVRGEKNLENFWAKLMDIQKEGSFLGAGSPPA
jgi:hypothetical protein